MLKEYGKVSLVTSKFYYSRSAEWSKNMCRGFNSSGDRDPPIVPRDDNVRITLLQFDSTVLNRVCSKSIPLTVL